MTEEQRKRWDEFRGLLRRLEDAEPGFVWERYLPGAILGLKAAVAYREAKVKQQQKQAEVFD